MLHLKKHLHRSLMILWIITLVGALGCEAAFHFGNGQALSGSPASAQETVVPEADKGDRAQPVARKAVPSVKVHPVDRETFAAIPAAIVLSPGANQEPFTRLLSIPGIQGRAPPSAA